MTQPDLNPSPDPFQLLGMPRAFDLDANLLQTKFITASAANHPDRFTDPLEQAEAAERSAAINEAHDVLRDPEKRANALLQLLGEPRETSERDQQLPPDFLMEIMERREAMEDAQAANDTAALAAFREWAEQEQAQHLQRIATFFHAHLNSTTTDTTPDGLITAVRKELNVLRYIQRMLEELN